MEGNNFIVNGLWNAVAFFVDRSTGYDQLKSMDNLLFMNDGIYSSFWSLVTSAYNIVVPFGFALITTFFLIHMYDIASKDQMSVESIAKALIGLVITVSIAGNLTTIVNTILSIGESMAKSLQGVMTNDFSSATAEAIADMQEANPGFGGALGMLIESFVIYMVHQIAVIVVDLAFCQRMLELGWRCALAPLGVANAFDGGANSSAIRYLKGLLAVAISGAAIYLVASLGLRLSTALFASDLAGNMWLAAAALLGAGITAMGAGTKVKEVIGA